MQTFLKSKNNFVASSKLMRLDLLEFRQIHCTTIRKNLFNSNFTVGKLSIVIIKSLKKRQLHVVCNFCVKCLDVKLNTWGRFFKPGTHVSLKTYQQESGMLIAQKIINYHAITRYNLDTPPGGSHSELVKTGSCRTANLLTVPNFLNETCVRIGFGMRDELSRDLLWAYA